MKFVRRKNLSVRCKVKEIHQFVYKRREGKEKSTCVLIMEGCKNLHMAILLQDRRETESDTDIDMAKIFQHLCQRLDTEVELDSFWSCRDHRESSNDVTPEDEEEDTTMIKMPLLLHSHPTWHDVFDTLYWSNTEDNKGLTEKSLLIWVVQRKLPTFMQSKCGSFV
jgi:hypothetical protein